MQLAQLGVSIQHLVVVSLLEHRGETLLVEELVIFRQFGARYVSNCRFFHSSALVTVDLLEVVMQETCRCIGAKDETYNDPILPNDNRLDTLSVAPPETLEQL